MIGLFNYQVYMRRIYPKPPDGPARIFPTHFIFLKIVGSVNC